MDNLVSISENSSAALQQIKLSQLSVYNWGSFNGLHTVNIDPFGTLITGDNGAGKSTLIDGLMALLLPAGKATFNVAAAQGDRADRTLLSYMRGSFGSAHDGLTTKTKSKREGAVVTGLRACYSHDDGSKITLAAIFWLTQTAGSLSDVKRIYIVAKRNLELDDLLKSFDKANIRALKLILKDDPTILIGSENFSEYQEVYRRLLHMHNKNAPALLSRALGLKKIDDLTGLIRDLVLEPSSVKDDTRKVVEEFGDLVGIHEQLIDARAQRDALIKLPDLDTALKSVEEGIRKIEMQRHAISIYINEQMALLWVEKILELEKQLNDIKIEVEQLERLEKQAEENTERLHERYINIGGNKIERMKDELADAQARLSTVSTHAAIYQKLAKGFGLDPSLNPVVANSNLTLAKEKLNNIDDEKQSARDEFANKSHILSNAQAEVKAMKERIAEIEARPNSNIPIEFQRMRDTMCRELNLKQDDFVFLGELADVKEDQQQWQGAIERALGGLKTTLAVPDHHYPQVTAWLNRTHTGLHVRAQVVDKSIIYKITNIQIKSDGFLNKLTWQNHPYTEWAKKHLEKYDLHCLPSTKEVNETPFSMTQQGLIQKEKGRFEKKDLNRVEDKRYWQLGFSNAARLTLLKNDLQVLVADLENANKFIRLARERMDNVEKDAVNWKRLSETQWSDIDIEFWNNQSNKLRAELHQLENSDNNLAVAKQQWSEAKQHQESIRKQKTDKAVEQAKTAQVLDQAKVKHQDSLKIAQPGLTEEVRTLLVERIGLITHAELDKTTEIEMRVRRDIDQLSNQFNQNKQNLVSEMAAKMSAFRQKWPGVAGDWGVDTQSILEYLSHFKLLTEEGLPNLVEQFKERLNKHTTQSIARIKSKIDSEKEDIEDRITTINRVLIKTEFKKGSFLRLRSKPESYAHVREFNQNLSQVLSESTSEDHETRFKHLQSVIEVLDKASTSPTAGTLESLRLLDPRHQLAFFAEEVDTHTREVKDVLASSSGKSGGEKESFAGTIVAASLAYVLTPDGDDFPKYSTVFLDEAFSNTAEAVSRRVLRVFRELKIHVNLITPYKNLNLARESAHSLIIAEREQSTHESRLCEVTWEEIDRQQRERNEQRISKEATELGIAVV